MIAVVQPHRFTRLASLFDAFATCFNDADSVIVADVYPAGEAPIEGVDKKALATAIAAHGHRHALVLPAVRETRRHRACAGSAGRLRDLPRRRLDHPMGLCAAGRTRGARQGSGDAAPMSFPDLVEEVKSRAPKLRGRLIANAPIAETTWFRVGGPAQVLFSPADEDDLAYLLASLPRETPVTTIGLGSNLIVRDGGVEGVVIRLGGRAFGAVEISDGSRVAAGAAAPDQFVARRAAKAGVDGLAFLRGVPGSIGGALAHERRRAWRRDQGRADRGARHSTAAGRSAFSRTPNMGFSYRHSAAPEDVVFTGASFQGRPGDPAAIEAEMERITRAREASQPIREKTGGSTFKNPPGHEGLGADRQGGLPRPAARRRGGLDHALQLSHQSRGGHGRRSRSARRGGEAPRSRDERRCARMGDQADRPGPRDLRATGADLKSSFARSVRAFGRTPVFTLANDKSGSTQTQQALRSCDAPPRRRRPPQNARPHPSPIPLVKRIGRKASEWRQLSSGAQFVQKRESWGASACLAGKSFEAEAFLRAQPYSPPLRVN